jgi:signal transduction histidine kinase/ActR/RegA family two-component response regulator
VALLHNTVQLFKPLTGRVHLLLVLIFIFAFVISIPTVVYNLTPREMELYAAEGAVDLRNLSVTDNSEVYAIHGEWEFYHDHLYTDADFRHGVTVSPDLVIFPHTWKDKYPLRGLGTYRMKIITPAEMKSIGVYMRPQISATRLSVDDAAVAQTGRIDPNFIVYCPGFCSLSVFADHAHMNEEELDGKREYNLILHVQNDRHAEPGLRGDIYVSGTEQIDLLESILNACNGLIVGIALVSFLYSLLTYLEYRKSTEYSDYAAISFLLLYCVFTYNGSEFAICKFIHDRFILEVSYRLSCLAFFIGVFFTSRRALNLLFSLRTRRCIQATLFALWAGYGCLPLELFTLLLPWYGGLTVCAAVAVVALRLLAAVRSGIREEALVLSVLSALSILLCPAALLPPFRFYGSIDLFCIFACAHMIFQLLEFLRTYGLLNEKMELLNVELARQVDIRTADLKLASERAEQAKQDALRANELKTLFLARMSHEIRTPMNVIIGFSEILLQQNLSREAQEVVQNIQNASDNLLSIINEILDISKVEAGKIEIVNRDYTLPYLIQDVESIIKNRIAEKSLRLISTMDNSLPSVLNGDKTRVRQILLNLLSNAVKYTREGFITFTVSGEKDPEDDGRITLRFVVSDTGIGIKQEDMSKLFVRFVRLDESRNQAVEGTGLGLVISQNLCRLMGGEITVQSAYGKGSVFTVTLPQKISDPRPIAKFRPEPNVNAKKRNVLFTAPEARILTVDDALPSLVVLKGLLAPYEMHIDLCKSGQNAISAVKRNHYDLIIMDHMMPGMDGMDTAKILRGMERGKDVPIIMLTANAFVGMKEMFLKSGFDDYLSKPIEVEKLDRAMDRWLPVKLKIPRTAQTEAS